MDFNVKKIMPLTALLCNCLFAGQSDEVSEMIDETEQLEGYPAIFMPNSELMVVPAEASPEKTSGELTDQIEESAPADPMEDSTPMSKVEPQTSPQAITPNAGPEIAHGVDINIGADFLWWRIHEDGLGYVTSGNGGGGGFPNPSQGSVYHPDWGWQPGFKVSLGVDLNYDGWDFGAEYTWLNPGSGSSSVTDNPGLYPMWNITNHWAIPLYSTTEGGLLQAFASSRTTFNVINLDVGRNFFISHHLKMRPFIGFKGSWQHQHYSVTYYAKGAEDPLYYTQTMSNNQKYWGVGLHTGFNTAWQFSKCWSLYGDFAASAMWSQFQVSRLDQIIAGPNVTNPNVYLNTLNSFHTIKPVLEWGLGLRWESYFSENAYHFLVQAGWEEQIWLNMNQLFVPFNEGNHGDLDLQGLTVKFRFDF
jgi:hypothetical protein